MTARLSPEYGFDTATGGARRFDLERVFRDSYGALIQEADAELRGVARPGGVVSRAFVRAWNERERFETPEALESFLHRAVRDGAARERYRRAVMRRTQERPPTAHGAADLLVALVARLRAGRVHSRAGAGERMRR